MKESPLKSRPFTTFVGLLDQFVVLKVLSLVLFELTSATVDFTLT